VTERYNHLLHGFKLSCNQCSLHSTIFRSEGNELCAQYTLLIENREDLRKRLRERGATTAVHYSKPPNKQPVYEIFLSRMPASGKRVI
jgi:hypothetical protein